MVQRKTVGRDYVVYAHIAVVLSVVALVLSGYI